MTAAELVRRPYEAYDARDWDAAAELLHEDALLELPATRERLGGRDRILGFQRAYPEPWGKPAVLRITVGEEEPPAHRESARD